MAQWKQTPEPYVKVYERVKKAALNPTAGEDLIIGAAFISDAGPSVPTLITSQSEFLSTYSSSDITEDYINSLNSLYSGTDKTLASTMWVNAYRLAGSNTILACRASKASDIFFSKPLVKDSNDVYILRDGELLKKVPNFKFVIDSKGDEVAKAVDGWSININGVGILGNRSTDEGPQYDYFVRTLPDLVEQLNQTSKFFSPKFEYFSDEKCESPVSIDMDNESSKDKAICVLFEEVYLGVDLIDTSDSNRCPSGLSYIISCEPEWDSSNPSQKVIDLNSANYSDFTPSKYYVTNLFNSSTDLRIRIRRFNHDAVVSKQLSEVSLNKNSDSPWTVLESVLNTYTKNGTSEPTISITNRDFYEVCILDPSVSKEPQFFNIGKIPGRGDMEVSELNSLLKMIRVELPEDMSELGLNYYDYKTDDTKWVKVFLDPETEISIEKTVSSKEELYNLKEAKVGDIYKVTVPEPEYYELKSNGLDQIYADVKIDPTEYSILEVSDSDLKKAIDLITIDEVYVTEGVTDLGNTEPSFQSYLANIAINENYFYPISTIQSTNYMAIANSASKLSQESNKLYLSAPWDIDTGTLGWKTYISPSVIFWEAVSRNRRNNEEFRAVLGQTGGIVQYQRPMTEFNKTTRQLLLTKKINTVKWNMSTSAWNMNDNYTKQSNIDILSDEGNSRLNIRISKAMPVLLRQFIGRKINQKLWDDAKSVIDYWMKTVVLSMGYTIDGYQIFIDEINNPEEIQRQNKMVVTINVRYPRTLKYIEVYNKAFDLGMDLTDRG